MKKSIRTQNFAFKFYARDAQESKTIQDIIDYKKIGSLPRLRSGNMGKK